MIRFRLQEVKRVSRYCLETHPLTIHEWPTLDCFHSLIMLIERLSDDCEYVQIKD